MGAGTGKFNIKRDTPDQWCDGMWRLETPNGYVYFEYTQGACVKRMDRLVKLQEYRW